MLLRAQRGLLDDSNPFIPVEQAAGFYTPLGRRCCEVADTNHYTILLGAAGARAVAEAILAAVGSGRTAP